MRLKRRWRLRRERRSNYLSTETRINAAAIPDVLLHPGIKSSAGAPFYEQKLGFTRGREIAGGVHYEFGNGTGCFMYPTPNAGTSRASQAFWQVDDVAREVAELRARGVTFEEYDMPGLKTKDGIATGGGAKTAWFKDSEGNILAIVESSGPT